MVSTVVYATVTELKAQPDIQFTKNDAFYGELLKVASRALDRCARRGRDGFVSSGAPTARTFVSSGCRHQWVDEFVNGTKLEFLLNPTVATFTEVTTSFWYAFRGDPEMPSTGEAPYHGIMLLPGSGVLDLFPKYDAPFLSVRVTADWGYATATPDQVKQATIALASRWIKRGQSFWADDTGSEEFGRLQYKPIDRDIKKMLAGLIRTAYGG